jgi:SH3-like domain-containing protein
MRPALLIGVLTGLFGSAAIVFADPEPEPYTAIIRVPEVPVQSGPSSKGYYATSMLHKGDKVHVVKQEDGWLWIVPPDGSFSWINNRFIGKVDAASKTALVLETADIRVGSQLNPENRYVTKTKLERGAFVIVMDDKTYPSEDGAWVKIYPPQPNEYRYIPASAVDPAAEKVQPVAPLPAAPPPPLGAPPSSQAYSPAPGDSLWYRAEQAERAGNPAEAERLFLQLARETPDHDLQMRCYNRIHFLREGRRPSYPSSYQAGRPNESYYPNNPYANRLAPTPGYPYTTTSRATSQYTYAPIPPAGQTPAATSTNPSTNCQWSGWGWLRRAPFFVDSKQAFVLENSQGMPRLYVTAQPGVNLESYVNKSVNLYGKMTYRGDLRTNYMTACQLTPLP